MKQHFLLLVLAVFFIKTNAQITLEHTFSGNVSWKGTYYADPGITQSNIYFTSTINGNQYNMTIYNADYTVQSNNTYNFTPPAGYSLYNVYVTKKLFNDDDNYEFLVIFDNNVYDDTKQILQLVDENGNVIKDFGTSYSLGVIPFLQIANNEFRFELHRYFQDGTSQTEIYYVPGQVPSSTSNVVNLAKPPYPNPSKTTILLPYNFTTKNKTALSIFNSSGKLIKSIIVNKGSDKIILDVSEFSKGTYFYKIGDTSYKFIVD